MKSTYYFHDRNNVFFITTTPNSTRSLGYERMAKCYRKKSHKNNNNKQEQQQQRHRGGHVSSFRHNFTFLSRIIWMFRFFLRKCSTFIHWTFYLSEIAIIIKAVDPLTICDTHYLKITWISPFVCSQSKQLIQSTHCISRFNKLSRKKDALDYFS